MSALRLIDGCTIELDGRPFARHLPGVSLRFGTLMEAFDAGWRTADLPRLESRIAELESSLAAPRGEKVMKGPTSTRGGRPGRSSGGWEVDGCPPTPKRASRGLPRAWLAGALMLAGQIIEARSEPDRA